MCRDSCRYNWGDYSTVIREVIIGEEVSELPSPEIDHRALRQEFLYREIDCGMVTDHIWKYEGGEEVDYSSYNSGVNFEEGNYFSNTCWYEPQGIFDSIYEDIKSLINSYFDSFKVGSMGFLDEVPIELEYAEEYVDGELDSISYDVIYSNARLYLTVGRGSAPYVGFIARKLPWISF